MIVPLPKKGDLSDCSNWRGIALLSIPGKIMASIMLNRMKEAMDNIFLTGTGRFLQRSLML